MQLARDFTDVSTYAFQIFKSQTVAVQIALSFCLNVFTVEFQLKALLKKEEFSDNFIFLLTLNIQLYFTFRQRDFSD